MGWEESLFGALEDLEAQAEARFDVERAPDIADRSRAEYQQVPLLGRLLASIEAEVLVDVHGVGGVRGVLRRVGAGWFLVQGAAQDWLIPTRGVSTIGGVSSRAIPEVAWSPLTRLSFGSAVRRLSEAGETCVVHTRDGGRYDGVVQRVGADFAEVGGPGGVVRLVPFDAMVAVQSREA